MKQIKKNYKIYLLILLIFVVIIIFAINLNNKKIEQFNSNEENIEVIDNYLIQLEKTLTEKNIDFISEKSKNKNVDSILITINSDEMSKKYQSYNINPNTKKVLNNEEIAKMFGYSLDDIEKMINERLKKYYEEEIEEGYVDLNECDYSCYLSFYRNIDEIESMYSLYVKNEKLNIYLSYSIDSFFSDEEYFKKLNHDPFKIEI